ncbi:MAG: nitroreductase family protein [Spirochaetaceae bacterium]
MELLKLMKSRYSARKYKDTEIKKEDLDYILEAGRVAPTAANRQTQRIFVIQSKAGIESIALSARTNNAPLIMIVCSYTPDSWINPFDNRDMNDIDCSIVSTHMILMAKNLGIDSLWLNWFDPEVLYEEFDIPKNYKIVNLLEFGYSAKNPTSPNRHDSERLSLEETVIFE